MRSSIWARAALLCTCICLQFQVTAAWAQSNRPPKIVGTPRAQAEVGEYYGFRPWARDPEGAPLRFRIVNRPPWGRFDSKTGRLHGAIRAPGRWVNIRIGVTDGDLTVWLPAYTLTAHPNAPPTIAGAPARAVSPGALYAFAPRSADLDGDTLSHTITHRPTWAAFDVKSGRLSGIPAEPDRGAWKDIRISVFDGVRVAHLPPFSIEVTPYVHGAVTLSWRMEHEPEADPADPRGYLIHYGVAPDALTEAIYLTGGSHTMHVVENLPPAAYYFAMRAVGPAGPGALSNIIEAVVARP